MASEGSGYGGLLVDWGGVLTSDVFDSFRAFCELEGLEADAIADAFRGDRDCRELLIALETGAVAEEEVELQLASRLGLDEPMLDAVRRARAAGIRTGLVSNSWGTRRYPWDVLAELFDGVVISGEVGLRKPAPGMYTLGAGRIGVDPGACVFVDDLPFNLSPAAELGMATVHHRDAEHTISELERLLGIDLR
jgi:putative hydrolase of the HAD superfamily